MVDSSMIHLEVDSMRMCWMMDVRWMYSGVCHDVEVGADTLDVLMCGKNEGLSYVKISFVSVWLIWNR